MSNGEGIGPVNIVVAVPTASADQGLSHIQQKTKDTLQALGTMKIPGLAWDAMVADATRAMKEIEQKQKDLAAHLAAGAPAAQHWSDQEFMSILGPALSNKQMDRLKNGPYGAIPPNLIVGGQIDVAADLEAYRRQQKAQVETNYLAQGGLPVYGDPRARGGLGGYDMSMVHPPDVYGLREDGSYGLDQKQLRQNEADRMAKLQAQKDKTAGIMEMVRTQQYGQKPDFAQMQRAERDEWLGGLSKSEKKGVKAFENDLEKMRSNLSQLPTDKLKEIESKLERAAMNGKDVNRYLDVVKHTMAGVGNEAAAAGGKIDGMNAKAAGAGSGDPNNPNHPNNMGRGSGVRSFRYVSQNMAYGFEDALTMYNMMGGGAQGARAAARAASNNISAFGTMIPSPMGAAGFIAGTAIAAAAVGPIADQLEQAFGNAKKMAEEYEKVLDRISTKASSQANYEFLGTEGGGSAAERDAGVRGAQLDQHKIYTNIDMNQSEREKKENRLAHLRDRQKQYQEASIRSAEAGARAGGMGIAPSMNTPYDKEILQMKTELASLDTKDALLGDELKKFESIEANEKALAEKARAIEAYENSLKRSRSSSFNALMANDGDTKPLTSSEMSKAINDIYIKQKDDINNRSDIPEKRKLAMHSSLDEERTDNITTMSEKAGRHYDDWMKRQKKAGDALSDKLTAETDARQGIITSYKRQREDINKLTGLSANERGKLLGLNDKAQEKKLLEYDQALSEKNPYKPLEGIDVGSRADYEMQARYASMGTSAKAELELTKQSVQKMGLLVTEAKTTNELLKKSLPKPANIRGRR